MKCLYSILLFWLFSNSLFAQDQPIIKLSQWQSFQELDPYVTLYIDSSGSQSIHSIVKQKFFAPPARYFTNDFSYQQRRFMYYLKVHIANDRSDTARYFFNVSPEKNFEVFALDSASHIESLPLAMEHQNNYSAKICHYTLLPGEHKDFILKVGLPYYASASIYFSMESEKNLKGLFTYLNGADPPNSFTWLFCGMLMMMFVYIVLKFFQIQSKEYFYYGAYIFFFLLYFLMRTIGFKNEAVLYGEFFSGIANDQLQAYAYIMYYFFVKLFLNTKTNSPALHKLLNISTVILLAYILIDSILFLFPDLVQTKNLFWDLIRVFLLIITGCSIFLIIKMKDRLGKFIIWGGLLLSFFGLLAMFFSYYPFYIEMLSYPFYEPITFFQIGIAAELICFSLGLGYKNRLVEIEKVKAEESLKIQAEREQFERYRAMADAREGERSRIAKDLHDGVGGLLSGVRISLANIQSKLKLEQDDALIYDRSLDMLDGSMQELRRVAHAMKPPSLEMFGLYAALRDYIEMINSMKTIKTILQCIGTEHRFEKEQELIIYRVIQELMNNVLKHAQATECLVQVSFLSDHLSITVEDNGKGFDTTRADNGGMGWSNIRQRIEYLKGSLDLNSSVGNGTSVQINIPFLT
jgi:signal transduction histidine kinase